MTIGQLVRRLYVTSVNKTDYSQEEVMNQIHDFGLVFAHKIRDEPDFQMSTVLECIAIAAHSPGMALLFSASPTAMRLIGTLYANIYRVAGYQDFLEEEYNRVCIDNNSAWKTAGDYYNSDIQLWWDASKVPQVMYHMKEIGSMIGDSLHVGRREDTYLAQIEPEIGAAWMVLVSKANFDQVEKLDDRHFEDTDSPEIDI